MSAEIPGNDSAPEEAFVQEVRGGFADGTQEERRLAAARDIARSMGTIDERTFVETMRTAYGEAGEPLPEYYK
jgi:hypothetical protein